MLVIVNQIHKNIQVVYPTMLVFIMVAIARIK
jgi:hypothetical protein